MCRLFSLVPALCCLLATASAAAGPYKHETEYKAAVKTEVSGDVAGALKMFEAIPASERDIATHVHIASCKRKLKRFVDADRDLEATLKLPGVDDAWRDTIASDRAMLEEQIARLAITAPADVVVAVDGAAADLSSEVRVDPGPHVVVATRNGVKVFEKTIDATPGKRVPLVIEIAGAPAPPPSSAPVVETPAAQPSAGLPAWPFFVAGGVFAGGFVGARVLAASTAKDVASACAAQHGLVCDEDAAGAGRVRTYDTLSIVAGVGALAAVGVGVALIVASPSSKSPSKPSAAIAPTIGSVNGLLLQGSF